MHPNKPASLCVAIIAGAILTLPAERVLAVDAANRSEIHAELSGISESRGPESKCTVSLKFTGPVLTNKMAILKARAIRATDDTGVSLLPPEGRESGGWGSSGGFSLAPMAGWFQERPSFTRYASVQLLGSARGAKTIKVLEGELELYSPTFENGGVIIVEDFMQQTGVAFRNPALAKLGVSLTYLTKESYEATKVPSNADPSGKRPFVTPMDQEADRLFPGILGAPENPLRNYVVLRVDDPGKRITSFAFREPGGRFLPVRQRRSAKGLHGFYFDTFAPEKLAVFVYLAVPEAIEKIPFKVENIALP